MTRPGRATLLFMTGTGNTARAAGVIADELSRSGWTTKVTELRKGADLPSGVFGADLLVLCFPVLGFGMPALVREMLKSLRGRGRPAGVFATWGGEGSAALWQARHFLRLKSFRVIASGGAAYPFQWTQVIAPPPETDARRMIDMGDDEAREFAKKLAANLESECPPRPALKPREILPVILGLLISFLYSWIGRFGLAALYAADEGCRACGKCARNCPADSIAMAGAGPRRRPRWRASCQGCNRCINLCPRAAVQVSPVRTGVHLLLNAAVIAAIVVGLNRLADAASLPALLSVPAYILALVALSVLGSRLQFSALEPLLFTLESAPPMRRLLARSWTAHFPRYRCDGFEPRLGRKLS